MNLVEEKQRGLTPPGIQSWQLQLIEHLTLTASKGTEANKWNCIYRGYTNPGGGGVLSSFLHKLARAQHLPFTQKKYQEFQAPPKKMLEILATQKKHPRFCTLTLRKDPKMHRNDH